MKLVDSEDEEFDALIDAIEDIRILPQSIKILIKLKYFIFIANFHQT